MNIEKIKEELKKDIDNFIEIRRHIHQNPELSMEEYETSEFIYKKLKEYGLKEVYRLPETGVVAIIRGNVGKTIAIRADIDALPILEQNDLSYKSKNDNVMHACGHDVHTTSLLGAAYFLNKYKDDLNGNIKLIFQPAEENGKGAKHVIENNILKTDPVPECIFALHSWPGVEAGKICNKHGKMGASSDSFIINIIGKSGHAAHPETTVDPIFILGNLILALQGIVSREIDPNEEAVLTISTVRGGNAVNAIPEEVEIKGAIRTLSEDTRNYIHKRVEEITENVCKTFNGKAEITLKRGLPVSYNDESVSNIIEKAIKKYFGEENYISNESPSMGSEDFAYYGEIIPGAMYRLGTGFKDKDNGSLHSSKFLVNEESIYTGILTMVVVANELLENFQKS